MGSIDLDRPRVLIVDDDQSARRTLTLILERKGFDVVTASSVQEGLERAGNGPFNVGLLDIKLPDGKGVDLLAPLKERQPDIELIMVTGYASTETAIQALNEGATAYITKPLNMDEVLLEVRKILDKQRIVAAKRAAEEQTEHVNAVLRAIRGVNQLIVQETDRDRLIQRACESLIETRGYLSALIVLKDGDHGIARVAAAGLRERTGQLRRMVERGQFPLCARRALDTLDVVLMDATAEDCEVCPLRACAGVDTGMAVALEHGGKVYGVLIVITRAIFAPADELSLFEEVGHDIALGLRGIELEEEQTRTVEMIRASERKFRTLFNSTGDAMFISDLAGNLLEVNEIACERLGYGRPELLSMGVHDLEAPAKETRLKELIDQLERSGHLIYETRHRCRDQTEIPVEVSSRLIDYEGRRVILGAARDISDRLKMEKQLHRQERLAAVGKLAGGIAHDFRNFLTTIILYADLARREPDLSEKTQEAFEIISSEAQKASSLIQQILDFSGRSSMETQPVDLVTHVKEVVGVLRRTIPESIAVCTRLEPDTAVIDADPTRLQQVLMNLALNARDAMVLPHSEDHGEGGELEISLARVGITAGATPPVPGMAHGDWIRLTVSDTGTGMSDDVKEHIFEPFFTTKERGQGTGLGLAQVYGIVQQHHGHIEVETEPGAGTSFHIYLPPHRKGRMELGAEPDLHAVPRGKGEKILLVEDQESIRKAGEQVLTALGYHVVTAGNGLEALEVLRDVQVDLIVTDVVMPEMGGKRLVRALNKRPDAPPVLAVTGYTIEEEMGELHTAGFVEVLEKPFDALSIGEAVHRALEARSR